MPSQDALILEQLAHLRHLTAFYAQKAMGGDAAELQKFLETQMRLVDLLPYLAGYQPLDETPQEAPAPLPHIQRPPPLRPLYGLPDDEQESTLVDERDYPTRVTFPPDPLFDRVDTVPSGDEETGNR